MIIGATSGTVGDVVRRRKPSVKWLQRELAEARKDLRLAGERLDATNIELVETRESKDAHIQRLQEILIRRERDLMQKNDELMQALNKRDEAREDRDSARSDANRIARLNQSNLDKAHRNGDIAAVLACLVAANNSPAEAMLKLSTTAGQMAIDSDLEILDKVWTALKRGYAAQVEQVVDNLIAAEGESSR